MATLKYRDRNGVIHTINPYQVHNVVISQEKGDSKIDVISQKAVSQFLDEIEDKIFEVEQNTENSLKDYVKIEVFNEIIQVLQNKVNELDECLRWYEN